MAVEPRHRGSPAGELQECSERDIIYGDDAADQIGVLFRQEGRINTFSMGQKYLCGVDVGYRIGESRECGHMGIGCIGGRIEANLRDRINLAR